MIYLGGHVCSQGVMGSEDRFPAMTGSPESRPLTHRSAPEDVPTVDGVTTVAIEQTDILSDGAQIPGEPYIVLGGGVRLTVAQARALSDRLRDLADRIDQS